MDGGKRETTTARGWSLSPLERIRDRWLALLDFLARSIVACAVGEEEVEVTVNEGHAGLGGGRINRVQSVFYSDDFKKVFPLFCGTI